MWNLANQAIPAHLKQNHSVSPCCFCANGYIFFVASIPTWLDTSLPLDSGTISLNTRSCTKNPVPIKQEDQKIFDEQNWHNRSK